MTWETILQAIVIGEALLVPVVLLWAMVMFSIKYLREKK